MKFGWGLVAMVAGCEVPATPGDDTEDGIPDTDTTDEDTATTPSSGGTTGDCAVATLDAQGGEVALGDDRVVVPADALDVPTDVTLCPASAPALVPVSAVLELGPADLVLHRPAEVHLTHTGGGTTVLLTPDEAGAPVPQLRAQTTGDAVTGPTYRPGLVLAVEDPALVVPYAPSGALVDLLFVVDDSCSMADEQLQLGTNFANVLPLLEAAGADYHVGIVTTDLDRPTASGRLREGPNGERWVDPTAADPAQLFRQLVSVGTLGSGSEKGLGAVYTAIELLGDTYNAGFVRDDARFATIVVSDEDDETPDTVISPTDFTTWYAALKLDPADVRFDAIVIDSGPGTATRYVAAAGALGGATQNIGTADWTPFLSDVVNELVASRGQLLDPVPSGTVAAWWLPDDADVEQAPIDPSAVVWDPATGRVTVDPAAIPADPGQVLLVYLP